MKRGWIGGGLLLGLLVLGLLSARYMQRGSAHVQSRIQTAGEKALVGDWTGAREELSQVREAWERYRDRAAFFADHSPMEEIDAQLSALDVYGAARERIAFGALCADLTQQLTALGEAHKLSWKNLF